MAERYEDPQVGIDAKKLIAHTLKVTANTDNFPKKYRFTIVNNMTNLCFEIYENIVDANNARGEKRFQYITRAISNCRKFRGYLEITLEVLHPKCSINYWAKMVNGIETQLLNWRRATKV